jgi:hypothetical protein
VVDAAVGHGARPLAVHGLGAVAVRVEQEPAVVVGAVRGPGAPLSRYPASDDPPTSGSHVTWVEPVLMSIGPDDDEERLRQRAWSFDQDVSGSDEARSVEDALKSQRILLTGGRSRIASGPRRIADRRRWTTCATSRPPPATILPSRQLSAFCVHPTMRHSASTSSTTCRPALP